MRPDWENYLFGLAYIASFRSHDSQTKFGCVIADPRHRILGVGYNGFPHSLKDAKLPTERPAKYPWMVHAERNALANCSGPIPKGAAAYVTGQCCNDCLIALWQHGIRTIYMWDVRAKMLNEETEKVFNEFVSQSGIEIHKRPPDISWIRDALLVGSTENRDQSPTHAIELQNCTGQRGFRSFSYWSSQILKWLSGIWQTVCHG